MLESKMQTLQLRGRSAEEAEREVQLSDDERERLRDRSLEQAQKELLISLDKAFEMYHILLSYVVAVYKEMVHRHDVAAIIALREYKNRPSTRFADNSFARQLADNEQLNRFMQKHGMDWNEHIDVVRKMCARIEQSAIYADYMADEAPASYEADREVWRKIYKYLVQDDDDLDVMFEEMSLYWNDDRVIVDDFVLKTIRRFREKNGAEQPLLPAYNDESDRQFALRLMEASLKNAEEYHRYMSEVSLNWDFDRLAYMDVVIMQTALAEMMTFQDIPISVTINEYVELSKLYSTSKSAYYINAMLDNIAHRLVSEGKLLKPMSKADKQRRQDNN